MIRVYLTPWTVVRHLLNFHHQVDQKANWCDRLTSFDYIRVDEMEIHHFYKTLQSFFEDCLDHKLFRASEFITHYYSNRFHESLNTSSLLWSMPKKKSSNYSPSSISCNIFSKIYILNYLWVKNLSYFSGICSINMGDINEC